MADVEEDVVESDFSMDTATLLRMQPLAAGLSRLYCSEGFTDLEIIRQERVWKVHKLCLCAQSDFFQSACGGNFLEASNNRISLDEDDPQTVACFIHYLYHFDYIDYKQSGISPIVLNVRMYVIADKYFVEPLKALAAKKFEEGAKIWWHTRAFTDAVVEVYQSAAKDSLLKDTIVEVVKSHAKYLLDTTMGYDAFYEVLGEIPEFGRDVSLALAASRLIHDEYHCPGCDRIFTIERNAPHFRCPRCDGVHNVTAYKKDWASRLIKK